MTFEQIESTAGILGGKPRIKNARISAELIVETIVDGASVADILRLKQEAVQKDTYHTIAKTVVAVKQAA